MGCYECLKTILFAIKMEITEPQKLIHNESREVNY